VKKTNIIRDIVIRHGKKTRRGSIIQNGLAEYGFLYDVIIELENNE